MCLQLILDVHVLSVPLGESVVCGVPVVHDGSRDAVHKLFDEGPRVPRGRSLPLRSANVVVAELHPRFGNRLPEKEQHVEMLFHWLRPFLHILIRGWIFSFQILPFYSSNCSVEVRLLPARFFPPPSASPLPPPLLRPPPSLPSPSSTYSPSSAPPPLTPPLPPPLLCPSSTYSIFSSAPTSPPLTSPLPPPPSSTPPPQQFIAYIMRMTVTDIRNRYQ